MSHIVTRAASLLNIEIEERGAWEIARRSRGTPRVANRLLKRVRDYAQIAGDGIITSEVADKALAMLEVDAAGLDRTDRAMLEAIIHRFGGGARRCSSLPCSASSAWRFCCCPPRAASSRAARTASWAFSVRRLKSKGITSSNGG